MIINTTDLNQIRNQIQKAKKLNPNEEIIVKAGNEELNRKVLEIKGISILLGPEIHNTNERKDKLKQRDSGLNEFLCKLAKKNNISIAIDLESLQKLDKKQKAKTLARIIQNIHLCKRTKTKIIIWPKNYQKQDIMGLMISLGSSTQLAKTA